MGGGGGVRGRGLEIGTAQKAIDAEKMSIGAKIETHKVAQNFDVSDRFRKRLNYQRIRGFGYATCREIAPRILSD